MLIPTNILRKQYILEKMFSIEGVGNPLYRYLVFIRKEIKYVRINNHNFINNYIESSNIICWICCYIHNNSNSDFCNYTHCNVYSVDNR